MSEKTRASLKHTALHLHLQVLSRTSGGVVQANFQVNPITMLANSQLAPVIQRLDSVRQSINHYPFEDLYQNRLSYPVDSDLFNRQTHPTFQQLGPGARFSKDPKTLRARKAIRKIPTRLFHKAGLSICCKGNKN